MASIWTRRNLKEISNKPDSESDNLVIQLFGALNGNGVANCDRKSRARIL